MPSIIPENDQVADVAKRLIAAADELGVDQTEIRTDTQGRGIAFVVSDEIAAKAGFGTGDEELVSDPAGTDEEIVDEPPREGEGSGRQAWRDFLTAKNVDWSEGDTQKQLIAKWDAQGSSAGE